MDKQKDLERIHQATIDGDGEEATKVVKAIVGEVDPLDIVTRP